MGAVLTDECRAGTLRVSELEEQRQSADSNFCPVQLNTPATNIVNDSFDPTQ